MNKAVAVVFAKCPEAAQKKLRLLRKMIMAVAKEHSETGELTETLKWGEPSYHPSQPKLGTTVRIAWKVSAPDQVGIYFNCNTNLVASFRKEFKQNFKYENNRAIIFSLREKIPQRDVKKCILAALTYYLKD